jgi:hypothetical protein
MTDRERELPMSDMTPINPLLAKILPEMSEKLIRARREILDRTGPLADDLRGVVQFLDFEIERSSLKADRIEWDGRGDKAATQERIQYLTTIRDTISEVEQGVQMAAFDKAIEAIRHLRDEQP